MTFRLVLVCLANVCRSPTAELLIRRALVSHGLVGVIEVRSAGLRPALGSRYCEWAAGLLGVDADVDAMLRNHIPSPLTADVLSSADLVLVAESRQVADVVRLSESASDKTFSLRRAADLAARTRPTTDRDLPGVDDRLSALVSRMRGLRGGRLPTRRGDIHDPHAAQVDIHPRMVRQVSSSTAALVATMADAALDPQTRVGSVSRRAPRRSNRRR